MTRRLERVNQLILREISELLRRQVKDPRLGSFITITEVTTSPDFRHARVLVSSIGGDEGKQEILSVLATASGFLRNELAGRLSLRCIPQLSFEWDDSIERGVRLVELIDKVSVENTSGYEKS